MQVNFDFESYRAMFSGGARSYLFFVPFNFPSASGSQTQATGKDTFSLANIAKAATAALSTFGVGKNDRMFPYLVKSTSLPETSFEEVDVKYGGISYKIAGNKSFGDWTVSLNIDEKGLILDKFHDWQKMIYNLGDGSAGLPSKYMADQEIHLLDYTGNTIKSYKLFGCWPKTIGAVNMDYSTNDTATIDITFTYLYYEMMSNSVGTNTLIKKGFNKLAGLI